MKKAAILILMLLLMFNSFCQFESDFKNGQKASEQGDYNKAITIFTEIINTQNIEYLHKAYYERAFCYYELKEYSKAKPDVLKALKIKKNSADYNIVKCNSYWLCYLIERKDGITSKSLSYLKKATRYLNSSDLYSTKGYAECYLGKYKKSLKSLDKAILIDSSNAWAYNNRALVRIKQNQFELARMDVEKSIQLDCNNPYAYKNSALIYIEYKDFESACRYIEKAENMEISKQMTGNDLLEELAILKHKYCETSTQK